MSFDMEGLTHTFNGLGQLMLHLKFKACIPTIKIKHIDFEMSHFTALHHQQFHSYLLIR
jgi:hypothetical protein